MSWTYLGDSTPKAVKRHRCYLCETHIELGQTYLARRGIGDDGPVTCKMHTECEKLTKDWTEEDWMYHDASEFQKPNAKFSRAADGSGSATTTPPALAETTCSARLPEVPGFFWWRETPSNEWRMVQIVDYTPKADRRHLRAYDVEMGDWRGRSIDIWAELDPVGEWLPVTKPNELAERPGAGGAT